MSKVSIEPSIDKESIWSKLNSVTVEKEKKGRFDYRI